MTVSIDPVAQNTDTLAAYLEHHDTSRLRPDAVFVDQTSGMRWVGPEAIAGMLEWFYSVAFEAGLEDSRVIVGSNGGVLEATFVGVHRGEFASGPATGREMRIPLVVIYDLARLAEAAERSPGGRP
jgi:hypothetical protein